MNKTKKKLCYNCKNSKNNSKSVVNKKMPIWKKNLNLKTHFPNDINAEIKVDYPKKFNTEYELKFNKKYNGRYVYYYCAEQKAIKDCLKSQYVAKAYGRNFKNRGVAKINKDGIAVIKFMCPQSYYVDLNKLHTPHIHYFISNNENTKWNEKLFTNRIVCKLTKTQLNRVINNDCAIIINALPYSEYIKRRIPNSISLPYDLVKNKKINENDILNYIKLILKQYPRINKLVKEKKLEIKNIPLVVYCYSKKCNASEILVKYLLKYGFIDIKEYPGGIVEWFNE